MQTIEQHPQITDWLDECIRETTRKIYQYDIKEFFTWYTKYLKNKNQPSSQPIETYLALTSKEKKRHIALVYQNTFTGKITPPAVLTNFN